MQAIILAAGIGKRLGEQGKNRPKALLEFGKKSLLERHIKILNHFNFSNIIVVSGYQADDLAKNLAIVNSKIPVQMVVNPDYEEGSIVSLSVAMDMLKENSEIILMDADVLYDSHIIKKLIGSDRANCLLLDRNLSENDVEAVKICVAGDKIVDFHKKITKEYDFCGESVGFFRFDSMMAGRLASRVKEYIKDGKRDIWYEEAIRDLILNHPDAFSYEDITGLPWIEIDFPQDIKKAEGEILTKLKDNGRF